MNNPLDRDEVFASTQGNEDPSDDNLYIITTKTPTGNAANPIFYRMQQADLASIGTLDPNNPADQPAIDACNRIVSLNAVVSNLPGNAPGTPSSCFCVALYLDTLDSNTQAAVANFKRRRELRFPKEVQALTVQTAHERVARAQERLRVALAVAAKVGATPNTPPSNTPPSNMPPTKGPAKGG